jgi:ribonuclease E
MQHEFERIGDGGEERDQREDVRDARDEARDAKDEARDERDADGRAEFEARADADAADNAAGDLAEGDTDDAETEDVPQPVAEGAGEVPEGEGEQGGAAAPATKPRRDGRRDRRSRGGDRAGRGGDRVGDRGGDRAGGDRAERDAKSEPHAFTQMLINYVAGEECRVAIVEDNKLEELHVERFTSASRVGNIYVGKVMNVEAAIQAAFVDFGVGENGFLHVTDLHPRYFPGEDGETTERVGLKTPRRERPPIQYALKRGDEIIVQVLKEGVGTKGPTLTSYLSIPGRFLVMMPYMDKVGVSRKVEDEELRRAMREILDQLELPDGFGFILRTAGMSRTKTELKRDLAYLMRLWKDMEKRLAAGGKPRLLYSESDLLVRALRDVLTNETDEVVIDNEAALKRAARFLKIVAPRTTTRLKAYQAKSPMFHAFGIEQQIALIHAREVPLPSGGRLVIDQTEALVAIDVNSGRSRDSRDSETNAYQTNIEAVDEICRQLRLRDMGGIVINDLIDMRSAQHRKDIENRVKERLRRDRAKSTVLQISEFGILEMTRQRMRPSHESIHFTDCPTCRGRGMLQKPDSVASDALRDLAAVLDVPRIAKVEMVVAPRVAGDLLSTKRQLLSRIERTYEKHVDVRVSETVAVDRVTFYAYDETGSDVDLTNLPRPRPPRDLPEWVDPDTQSQESADWAPDEQAEAKEAREGDAPDDSGELDVHPIEIDVPDEQLDAELAANQPTPLSELGDAGRRRRRRRGRGARGGDGRADARGDARSAQAPRPEQRPQQPQPPRDARDVRDGRPTRDGAGGPRDGRDASGRVGPRRDDRGPRRDQRQGGRFDDRDDRGDRGSRPDRPMRDDSAEWGEPPSREPAPIGEDAPDEPLPHDQPSRDISQDARGAGRMGPQGEQELGPDGQPRRKRRRRRRRGRGRGDGSGEGMGDVRGEVRGDGQGNARTSGRAQDGAQGEQPVDSEPEQGASDDAAVDAGSVDEWGEPAARPPARPAQLSDAPVDERDQGDDADDRAEGSDQGPDDRSPGEGQGDGGDVGEGGRKRRRRRRRGRGRGRGGDAPRDAGPDAGASPEVPQREARSPERSPDRPPQRPRDLDGPASPPPRGEGVIETPVARVERLHPEPKPRSEPRPEPRPEPKPQPKAQASPPASGDERGPSTPEGKGKLRTLYGALRRKLKPGELNKRPKPE